MNFDINKKIENKNLVIRYFLLTVFLFMSAVIFNLFLRKNQITTGGINGVAIIFEKLFGFEPAFTIFFFSLILLILSFFFLNKSESIGNITTTILYPIFVKMTSNITDIIVLDNNNIFVVCLFAGFLGGISVGYIYKMGFSNGGFSIINQFLYKYFKISISKSSFFINAIIVIIGGIIFNYEMALYAIIILYINSLMINKVMIGISSSKMVYIITNLENSVKKYLEQELNIKYTIFKSEGAYTNNKKNIIFIVVPTKDYYKLTEKLKEIDREVFFIVTDSYHIQKKC